MMLAYPRFKDWAIRRNNERRDRNSAAFGIKDRLLIGIEGSSLGEPVRLRAECEALRFRLAVERHATAKRDWGEFECRFFEPDKRSQYPSYRESVGVWVRHRRGAAFAARLALRLSQRWHATKTLPERWEEALGGNLPMPDPQRMPRPTYERRERGFVLRVPTPPYPSGATEPFELAVDFPRPP